MFNAPNHVLLNFRRAVELEQRLERRAGVQLRNHHGDVQPHAPDSVGLEIQLLAGNYASPEGSKIADLRVSLPMGTYTRMPTFFHLDMDAFFVLRGRTSTILRLKGQPVVCRRQVERTRRSLRRLLCRPQIRRALRHAPAPALTSSARKPFFVEGHMERYREYSGPRPSKSSTASPRLSAWPPSTKPIWICPAPNASMALRSAPPISCTKPSNKPLPSTVPSASPPRAWSPKSPRTKPKPNGISLGHPRPGSRLPCPARRP